MKSSNDITEAIAAVNESFMATYRQGDAAGRQALQAMFQAFMDMGIKTIELAPVEAEGCGDTAFEVGRYTFRDARDRIIDRGKYVVVWKHDAGQWRLHRDIFNSSLPA